MSTPIEQIKARLTIVDVVSPYVKLQKAGKHLKGKSPFTNEKTPSFFVSPERGMYYCFSTGKGGDIFTFISEMEGIDFKGALKILAEKAGVELVPEDPARRSYRDNLYHILEDATVFFETGLKNSPESKQYLHERGVTEETIHAWRIGFAPNAWRALFLHLRAKGYSQDALLAAGLIKIGEKKAEPYDVFRHRIMFPICDVSGRVVGFSGRDRSGDEKAPKYVNSPETELYNKSHILFGYDKAKNGIRTLDFSLIVEGQFDLVLSHQAGYTNTVAISGTAMTGEHVALLSRLSNRIVLALDADRAGIASAKRAATIALAREMDVKVAHIEGGKDPADLVREDPKLLKACVGRATHIIPFLLDILRRETQDERSFLLRTREEVVPFIALMPNRIDAEHFEALLANETHTTKDAIHFEVERLRDEARRESSVQTSQKVLQKQAEVPPRLDRAMSPVMLQKYLYGVLVWQEQAEERVIDVVRFKEYLKDILGETLLDALAQLSETEKNALAAHAEHEAHIQYAGRVSEFKNHLRDRLGSLSKKMLEEHQKKLRIEMKDTERSGDTARYAQLFDESGALLQRLQKNELLLNQFRDI